MLLATCYWPSVIESSKKCLRHDLKRAALICLQGKAPRPQGRVEKHPLNHRSPLPLHALGGEPENKYRATE